MNLKLDDLIPRILFRTRNEAQSYEALATMVLAEQRAQDPGSQTAPDDLHHKITESVDRLVKHGWVHKRFESVAISYLGIERLRASAL